MRERSGSGEPVVSGLKRSEHARPYSQDWGFMQAQAGPICLRHEQSVIEI